MKIPCATNANTWEVLSPLLALATLVAIAIALFVAFTFTHPTPLLLLHWRSGGGGKDHPDPVRNLTLGHRCQCYHRCHCHCFCHLCCPRNQPGGAGPTTHRLSMPGRQHGGADVGICGAGIVLPASQWQRRRWWCHCKVWPSKHSNVVAMCIVRTKECFEGHTHPRHPQKIYPLAHGVIAYQFDASVWNATAHVGC